MRLGVCALLLGPLLAAAPGCEAEFEDRVEAPPGGQLWVDLDLGEGLRPDPGFVEIASREADEVRVRAESTGWGARGVRLRLEREGETVRVDGGVSGAFSWLFGGPRVRLRIWVPRRFDADVRSTGGPIRIEELQGAVRARGGAADVEVSAVEGPVRVRLDSGSVRVSEISGDVDVRLRSGQAELSWVRGRVEVRAESADLELSHIGGPVTARSDSGSIELHDVDGPCEAKTERGSVFASFTGAPEGLLETRRGSVEVRIPARAGVDLEGESGRGQVELAGGFAAPDVQPGERIQRALNGGGRSLRLYTARGSVVVRPR